VPVVQEVIRTAALKEESFYVYSHAEIQQAYKNWTTTFPYIKSYYAVKSNAETTLLSSLAHFGSRFDCASPSEIERVLALGVPAEHIIFANPCKRVRDLLYARACGVRLTTLDSYSEIDKIADACGSDMAALLRIFATDPNAQCVLSNKFGCMPTDWPRLFARMKERGVECRGVSFHVGSGACTPSAFAAAIESAAKAFECARAAGHNPTILDIGGGFSKTTLATIAETVNDAIERHFPEALDPEDAHVEVIAEPGRLFSETSAAFAIQVIGVRDAGTPEAPRKQYWVTDGLYGSFNCILFDHAKIDAPTAVLDRSGRIKTSEAHGEFVSDVFGPTCDGLDVVLKDTRMPAAEMGDWLVFGDMGAYTIAGATTFNGILFNQVRTFQPPAASKCLEVAA